MPTDEISQLGYFGNDNDGKSWADAYTTLERALGVATNGDEIWVASGIYTPTRLATTEPLDPRFATFQLGIGVAHYGGFAGNETSLSQRNPDNHVTVLSGDIDGNDTTNGQGVVLEPGNIVGANAYHVVSSLSVGDGITTLDGFTITAGKAIYNGGAVLSKGLGGGIYHVDGSPNFVDLIIQGNEADSGGGMYAIIGRPSLSQVHFEANSADDGGGMYNHQADPQFEDVMFQSNWAADSGGGMLNIQANASLDQVIFNDNRAGGEGGGVANFDSQPVFIRTILSENESGIGGAIYNSASDMQISFSEMVDNVASGYGGGFHNASSDPLIVSTDFSGNDGYQGGAIHNDSSSPTIQRSAFTSNSALTNGGGMSSSGAGAPKLSQVTFSGNSAGVNGGGIYQSGGEFSFYNAFFDRNTAGISGGGGYFLGSTTNVGNAVFLANAAASGEGGGFVSSDSFMQMSNVTVAHNSAGSVGGGAFISGLGSDGSLLANSIFWGNGAGSVGPEIYITGGFAISETFNLISGTVGVSPDSPFDIDPDPGPDETWGTGDDDLGYLRPKEMSQATDAGSNSYVLDDILDLDGDGDMAEALPLDVGQFRRIYNGTVDIGAYEWGLVFRYLSLVQK